MAGYYASCDVFCSPATGQESQGIVLLEAMAAGRPPVAFAIPGYRDVVQHGVDGWLVDRVGARDLAQGLNTVSERSRWLCFGWPKRGEKKRSVFPGRRVVEQIELHYARALEKVGGGTMKRLS